MLTPSRRRVIRRRLMQAVRGIGRVISADQDDGAHIELAQPLQKRIEISVPHFPAGGAERGGRRAHDGAKRCLWLVAEVDERALKDSGDPPSRAENGVESTGGPGCLHHTDEAGVDHRSGATRLGDE